MTDLERIQLRRELEKAEKLMALDERTRSELFRLAEEMAGGSAENITTNYKRIAKVVREFTQEQTGFKRGVAAAKK